MISCWYLFQYLPYLRLYYLTFYWIYPYFFLINACNKLGMLRSIDKYLDIIVTYMAIVPLLYEYVVFVKLKLFVLLVGFMLISTSWRIDLNLVPLLVRHHLCVSLNGPTFTLASCQCFFLFFVVDKSSVSFCFDWFILQTIVRSNSSFQL